MKRRPTDESILEFLVPRLKELKAAGSRVFVEIEMFPHEVLLDEADKPYAHFVLNPAPIYINLKFFDKQFKESMGVPPKGYDITDAMNTLWVEITVANYKEKITSLTTKT